MKIKDLIEEDICNYKKTSMFIIFPTCTWKCEKECGIKCCQNEPIAKMPIINIEADKLIERYLKNPLSHAVVCGGLEPMDSFDELYDFINKLRMKTDDDVVIYTGYNEVEISDKIDKLRLFKNIVVKFGRFIPNSDSKYDDVLGVKLASENQYAIKIN